MALEAGRIMINRITELINEGKSFAFETTLSSITYKEKVLRAKEKGYFVTLLFFWLQNTQLAKERVKVRVKEGGHNILPDVIVRRYHRGIINLFDIYLPIVDRALFFDNSLGKHEFFAEKTVKGELIVTDKLKFKLLKNYYER